MPPPGAKLPAVASWDDFRRQAPDLADAVHARLTATLHTVLGTLKADGAPRLTGLEVHFSEGELWLAMMPDSRKADDLRRDPRFSVHSAPDVSMVDGDAKVGGRALEVARRGCTSTASPRRFPSHYRRAAWPCSGPISPRPRLPGSRVTIMVIDIWHDGEAAAAGAAAVAARSAGNASPAGA